MVSIRMLVWQYLAQERKTNRMKDCVTGQTPPGRPYPRVTAQCAHCPRRCLRGAWLALVLLACENARANIAQRTMNVVLENSGLVDSREVAVGENACEQEAVVDDTLRLWLHEGCGIKRGGRAGARRKGACTYPLVKTFNNDVLPQAPSPLWKSNIVSISVSTPSHCLHIRRALSGRHPCPNSQQDQLALHRFGATTQKRHLVRTLGE